MTKSVSCSVELATSPCTKAAQRVSRKYSNTHRRKLQRKEYKNLKKVLPALSTTPKVSKTDVIEEAIKYIDFLHAEIAHRFYSGGVFKEAKEQSPMAETVKRLALHPQKLHPSHLQHQQTHPVFHYSQSFIEAGSQLAGPEFLHYQRKAADKSTSTRKLAASSGNRSSNKDIQAFSEKTIKLRL